MVSPGVLVRIILEGDPFGGQTGMVLAVGRPTTRAPVKVEFPVPNRTPEVVYSAGNAHQVGEWRSPRWSFAHRWYNFEDLEVLP